MPAVKAIMHYKCAICGQEVEHEPSITPYKIASCPKCGRRETFTIIAESDIPTDSVTDSVVTDPVTDPN